MFIVLRGESTNAMLQKQMEDLEKQVVTKFSRAVYSGYLQEYIEEQLNKWAHNLRSSYNDLHRVRARVSKVRNLPQLKITLQCERWNDERMIVHDFAITMLETSAEHEILRWKQPLQEDLEEISIPMKYLQNMIYQHLQEKFGVDKDNVVSFTIRHDNVIDTIQVTHVVKGREG